MSKRCLRTLFGFVVMMTCIYLPAQEVVRIVTWQPKPGMERSFEEGYKRHLNWHRANKDRWKWEGWTLTSGERADWFTDATFGHKWSDFDTPLDPAGDGADNEKNVAPFADLRDVTAYEVVAATEAFESEWLKSRFLTFVRFEIAPGREAEFESEMRNSLQKQGPLPYMLLRPASGTVQYLVLIPAGKASAVGEAMGATRVALAPLAQRNLAVRVSTETARYRPELSYQPE